MTHTSLYDATLLIGTVAAAVFIDIGFAILIGVDLSFCWYLPRAGTLKSTELVVSSERVVRKRQPSDPPNLRSPLVATQCAARRARPQGVWSGANEDHPNDRATNQSVEQ